MGEFVLRHFRLIPDTAPIQYQLRSPPEFFSPKPLLSTTSLFGIEYRLNSLGLRGPERPEARSPNVTRIAALGDSVAFGFGVSEEDTFRSQLETLLNEVGGERRFEVWNLGVPASDTYNQAARFHRLAPFVKPDLTVVLVLYNDLVATPTRFRISSTGLLAHVYRNAPYPDSLRPVLEGSAIFQLALKVYSAIVALVPSLNAPAEQYEEFARLLETDFGDWPDGDFIDLGVVLAALGNEAFLPHDQVHLNAGGYGVAAEALLPLVQDFVTAPVSGLN